MKCIDIFNLDKNYIYGYLICITLNNQIIIKQ